MHSNIRAQGMMGEISNLEGVGFNVFLTKGCAVISIVARRKNLSANFDANTPNDVALLHN